MKLYIFFNGNTFVVNKNICDICERQATPWGPKKVTL